MLAYCDMIAYSIKENIEQNTQGFLQAGKVNMDLHPTEGYFLSTKKTLSVTDKNGKAYMVTVEEV